MKWDIVMLLLILYSTITVPFRVCFPNADATGITWYFEVSMSFCFLADCIFSFFLAYMDGGRWVTNQRSIASSYLKGWFWIDGPSSLPLELLDLIPGSMASRFAMLRFLRMFRLLRLLKLLKLNEILEQLEDLMQTNLRGFRLLFEIFKMVFFAHTLGCFWFGIGAASRNTYFGGSEDVPTWYATYKEKQEDAYGLDDIEVDAFEYYRWSLYWALTTLTTVGYGDITPTNTLERSYASVALLLGGFVFGLMLSNVGVLVASLDRQAAAVEEKIDAVKEYAVARDLPRDLTLRLRKHFKYYYSATPVFDEHALLSECPPLLRAETEQHIMRNTLGKVPLIARLDPDFQSELFPYIKPVSYSVGDMIFRKGEVSRELLFLVQGEVNVISTITDAVIEKRITPKEEIHVAANANRAPDEPDLVVPANGILGDDVLRGQRRRATHIAHTDCQTLSLSRDDLLKVFKENPRAAKRIIVSVLGEFSRKERLRNLTRRVLIGITSGELKAALVVQQQWSRYVQRFLTIAPHFPELEATPAEVDHERKLERKRRASLDEARAAGLKILMDEDVDQYATTYINNNNGDQSAHSQEVTYEQLVPEGTIQGVQSFDMQIAAAEERILRQVTAMVRAEFQKLRSAAHG